MPVGEHSTDEELMRLALAEAHTAAQNGEVPVGAVVSLGGQISLARATGRLGIAIRRRMRKLSRCGRRRRPWETTGWPARYFS